MFAKKKSDSEEATKPSPFDRALKWVTALTAIIYLFFAVQKVTQTIADNTARTQQIAELLRVASMQQQAMDYSRAWDSLAKAAQLNDSGDVLAKLLDHREADIAKVRSQREDLAMAWLENITVPEGKTFSDAVDKLVSVLEAGTANAPPQHKADLLAHIGWSYFLRSRDGHNAFDPSQQYAQALTFDAQNPYAHSYWAHWLLWQNDNIESAREHFAKALESNRARAYVRDIELVAFNNLGQRGESFYVATISDMQKNREPISNSYLIVARRVFENACGKYGRESLMALKTQIPKADLVAAYTQLIEQIPEDEKAERAHCLDQLKAS